MTDIEFPLYPTDEDMKNLPQVQARLIAKLAIERHKLEDRLEQAQAYIDGLEKKLKRFVDNAGSVHIGIG